MTAVHNPSAEPGADDSTGVGTGTATGETAASHSAATATAAGDTAVIRTRRKAHVRLSLRARPGLATAVHLATLPLGFGVLMFLGRNLWFVGDDWDFLLNRGFHHPEAGVFVPHSEHWSTVPIIIWRAMFTLVGLRHYWPYYVFVVAAHLVVVHLLWRLAQRLGVTPWVATIVATSVILLGVGAENLLWAFQIGFVGSVAFGLGALLLIDSDAPWWPLTRRTWGAWILAVLSLASSGVGVTMVICLVLTSLLRRGFRAAIVTGSVPTLVYALWYEEYGRVGLVANPFGVTQQTLPMMPTYVLNGLTAALSGWSGVTDGGAVLMIGIAAFVATLKWRGPGSVVLASTITAVVFFIISGFGRIGIGVLEGGSSRYSYVAMALLLPAIFMIFQRLADRGGLVAPAVVSVALLCVGLGPLVTSARQRGDAELDQQRRLTADAQLLESGAGFVAAAPLPHLIPGLTTTRYAQFAKDGVAPRGKVSAKSAQLAHLEIQTAVSQTPTPADDLPRALGAAGVTSMHTGDDCVTVTPTGVGTPQVAVRATAGVSAFSISISTPGNIGLYDGSAGPLTSQLPAGTSWVRIVDAGALITVSLPAGTSQVCHLAFS